MAEYSKELEAAARQRGFKSASEMVMFERQKSANVRKTESSTTSKKGTPPSKDAKKPESAGGGMAGFFEGLARVLDRATKK